MKTATLPNLQAGGVRIASIRVHHVRIPLRKKVSHASHSRTESENLIVECRLDDGTVGFGEGVPRDYVTGETVQTSFELLRQTDWETAAFRANSFPDVVNALRHFQIATVPGDDRRCIGNAARCAAEMAILDAYGQRYGVSLKKLATYLPECTTIAEERRKCRYSGAITSKRTLGREKLSTWKVWLGQFHQCKIKVGSEGQNDVERLRSFRKILGSRVDFRVDANEAWTPENVVGKIQELEPFGITAVEQPIPHEQISCLREVRRTVKTPIMHDESLCSRVDAERAIAGETCDLFNLRISKCGGLIPTLELAALAHAHGLGYQLGCQIGETGVLSAAGRHVACSIRGIRYLEGSYDHFLVREWLTRENLTFEWRGVADALKAPGLGVHIDMERLKKVTLLEEQVYG